MLHRIAQGLLGRGEAPDAPAPDDLPDYPPRVAERILAHLAEERQAGRMDCYRRRLTHDWLVTLETLQGIATPDEYRVRLDVWGARWLDRQPEGGAL